MVDFSQPATAFPDYTKLHAAPEEVESAPKKPEPTRTADDIQAAALEDGSLGRNVAHLRMNSPETESTLALLGAGQPYNPPHLRGSEYED